MPDFPFTGKITQNIYNQASVGPNRPNTLPFPTNSIFFENSIAQATIDWGSTLPPSNIRNLTLFDLVNNLGTLFRTITVSPTVQISSGEQTNTLGNAQTYLQFTFSGPTQTVLVVPLNSNNPAIYAPPTRIIPFANVPPSNISEVYELGINVYNDCGSIQPGVCDHAATGYTLDVVFNISLTLICEGVSLENAFCSAFCEAPGNLNSCLPDYQTFCFTNGINGDPIITTSVACQEFFKDYVTNVGVDSQLDTTLQNYCQAKYAGFDDLLDVNGQRNTQSEIDLCACNLNPQLYENLRAALIAEFPAYAGVAENSRCLFPQCVDSPYKNSSTTQHCALPNCINIASISNDGGNIGGVTINQGATGCANIVGGTGATGNNGNNGINSTKTFLEQHWVWIVLGVGILVVLIIVILIIIAAESDKPKRKG